MRYGKNILIVTVLIGIGLFFYIRQVNADRASTIALFMRQPERGDIYKIRYNDGNGNTTVRYYKISGVDGNSISFFRGKLSAWNVSDVFLDDFESDREVRFTPKDLDLMKSGNFSNAEMQNARLIEIERKADRIPTHSL